MKVINFWAGPGAGKSTLASGLFYLMKTAGHNVELVTEFAKDLTYEKRDKALSNHLYILAEQDMRLRRMEAEGVDWAITDSPLPLTCMYSTYPFSSGWFRACALGTFRSYTNINYRIIRVKPYNTVGRSQTEDEAQGLDASIHRFMLNEYIAHTHVVGGINAPDCVYNDLKEQHGLLEPEAEHPAVVPRHHGDTAGVVATQEPACHRFPACA